LLINILIQAPTSTTSPPPPPPPTTTDSTQLVDPPSILARDPSNVPPVLTGLFIIICVYYYNCDNIHTLGIAGISTASVQQPLIPTTTAVSQMTFQQTLSTAPSVAMIPANNRIYLDGRPHEVKYVGEVAVVERDGLPHRVYFHGTPRQVRLPFGALLFDVL
jgi:hypothetical protein